jgi:hypothetical protein
VALSSWPGSGEVVDRNLETISAQRLGYPCAVSSKPPSFGSAEEHVMNTSVADTVVVELSEDIQPADVLMAWAERSTDRD